MTAEKTELAKKDESTRDLTADENELKAAYVAAAEALTGGVAVGAELDADTLDELLKRVAPPVGPDGVEETAKIRHSGSRSASIWRDATKCAG